MGEPLRKWFLLHIMHEAIFFNSLHTELFCMLFCHLLINFKINVLKNHEYSHRLRVNSLEQDILVGPDLGPNCLQRLSAH